MTRLPAISESRRAGSDLAMRLDLTQELIQFDGHFPGMPMLPAVAQIDWAITLARDGFSLPARVRALRSLKFLRIVQPPVQLTLELSLRRDGCSVDFVYAHGGSPCATGRIEFADDAPGPDRSVL